MDGLDDDLRFCPDESRLNFDPEDAQAFTSTPHFHSFLVAVFCLGAAFALSSLHKLRAHRAQAKSHGGAIRPIKVGCFYCGCTQTVLELQKDSWTCGHCDALNVGFNEDGDYRTVPREMYDETLNCRIPPREMVNPSVLYFSTTRETVSPQNVLCERCQINQTLWLQQLSSFVPKDERSEDKELEVLKRHLDRVYALCSQCATGVAAELERKHKVIEHMSITKRIAESAKNNIRKMRTSKQIYRSFNKCLRAYRVLSLVLLLAAFGERLYAKTSAESDEEGVGEELLVERCLLVLLRCPSLLKDALCYLALSLLPLDLMLAACHPKGALLPHKHTPQLFVELFMCCLQAIPLLDMKSERVALDVAYWVLNLCSVLLLLLLELPVAEVVFSRLVRREPSFRVDRSSEQERESASLPVSPLRTCTSASASTSASPFCYQTTLRQRQQFPPAPLAFTAPPNPFSQLGVEDELANISLFEEDAMAMDWNLH